MDFRRFLEAILEGFWMPESMQKSIEFWMDSRRGSGTILASKIGPKSFQKLIWTNSKNLDFVWRVLQKWRYGALEIQPKCVQKLLRKFITFLMIFERLLASILHPKIIQKCIKIASKIDWCFYWFLDWFWHHFGRQNASKIGSKTQWNLECFLKGFLNRRCCQKGRPECGKSAPTGSMGRGKGRGQVTPAPASVVYSHPPFNT